MKFSFIILFFFTITLFCNNSLKEEALVEFKKEHYEKAISLLEEALKKDSSDAEIFFYLGWFNHYRAYDSRPLAGYDFSYSEKIFNYLDKAILLNPKLGNARYFYGVECSANAFLAMQNYDLEKLKYFYKLAEEKGAYPNWLKEFGRNILNSCAKNAILFTAGNLDFDICLYLQLFEKLRTDITLIPIGNIDRPWYLKFLKKGLGTIKKIKLDLTAQQIMDLHPFKWDTTTVAIAISDSLKKCFQLPENSKFNWQINPDLFSQRKHAKIAGEKVKYRKYLSPQRAILVQIIESNFEQRPIYFSNFCSPSFYAGLQEYFQNWGLVSLLTPLKTKNTDYHYDYQKIRKLLKPNNLKDFKNILNQNMTRISGVVIYGYYNALLNLLESKISSAEKNDLENLFKEELKIGLAPNFENDILKALEKIKNSN